jgi:hypothetical protein
MDQKELEKKISAYMEGQRSVLLFIKQMLQTKDK